MVLKTIETIAPPIQQYECISPVRISVAYSTTKPKEGHEIAVDFFEDAIRQVNKVIDFMKSRKSGLFLED